MIFDAHSDIWTHVTMKSLEGRNNIFKNYHLEKYIKGGVNGSIFVIWVDPPYDSDPFNRTMQIVKSLSKELLSNKDIIQIVRNYSDIQRAVDSNKIAIIIGIEGLSSIGNNIDLLYSFYMLGARHASLTWNEENELATGVKGDPNRGLTQDGVKAVKTLEELGMLVDVSHANEKSFWDICKYSTKPIIASHSNCKALCNVARNLTDNQLRAISERNGVVGLNAFSEFISENKENRDIYHLADHIDHMVDVMGINHVGFGFDFVDYLEDNTVNSFSSDEDNGDTKGFENITKVPDLISILEARGYDKEALDKIKYKNFMRVIKEVIK